jgi:hypothetical protein
MNIVVIMRYFDALNDENAMYIEFKDGGKLLVDCNDIIRAEDDLIEIKSSFGSYITESSNVSGLRILNRVDIMAKAVIENMINAEGEE